MQTGGGRTYVWNEDNQPTRITGADGVPEDYTYDADGTRVSRKRGAVTTIYLGGLVEQEGTTTRTHYGFGGQVLAQREGSSVIYLHGDHLGSISVATSSTGAVVSKQEYTPWGEVRSGGITETTLNYTGQRKDGTGLLFYNARYYDPALARFVSADSIVPGASGSVVGLDDAKLTPLTVDFHEPGLISSLNDETEVTLQEGFWFQLGDQDQQKAKSPWGPSDPQTLNRYSYVVNNPLRYTDPTGHMVRIHCSICGKTWDAPRTRVGRFLAWLQCLAIGCHLRGNKIVGPTYEEWAAAQIAGLGGLASPMGVVGGTRGLSHSFMEHAAQWFGRAVKSSTHLAEWQGLIERAARSAVTFEWSTGNAPTIAHLARIDGKWFVVQFFKEGPRKGELATAFVPGQDQVRAMLERAGYIP